MENQIGTPSEGLGNQWLTHLNTMVAKGDQAAIEQKWTSWYRSLGVVYRSVSAYIKEKDREKIEQAWKVLTKWHSNYIYFASLRQSQGRFMKFTGLIPTSVLPEKLHSFDLVLKKVMKDNHLLLQEKEDDMGIQ